MPRATAKMEKRKQQPMLSQNPFYEERRGEIIRAPIIMSLYYSYMSRI